MLQLAIECSGVSGSIALFQNQTLSQFFELPRKSGSVESLAPAIAQLLQGDVPDFISVTIGPGSFTSLRVGLTMAKMLAFAWERPLVGIDTLDLLACSAGASKRLAGADFVVIPSINAFRKQVFTSAFEFADGQERKIAQSQVVDATKWMQDPFECLELAKTGIERKLVICTGPGLNKYLPEHGSVECISEAEREATAQGMGRLADEAFAANRVYSAADLLPNYVRGSAAEEKLA